MKGRDAKNVSAQTGASAPGLALASVATGDPAPCREAWERHGQVDRKGPESRMADDALFYDWCHPHLSADEKKTIRARLARNIDNEMKEGRLWRSFHNAGPSAAFNVTVNALAIHGEDPIAEKALAFVMPELEDMRLVVDRLFPDGEWAEGMDYARHSNHHLLRTFLALGTATGRDFVRDSPNLRNFAKTIIYATKPDGRMFPSDDNDWPYVNEWDHRALLMAASTFRDPYAQWFLNHCPFDHFQLLDHTRWAHLLWYDEHLPEKPLTDLPLARLFAGKGIVMARSGWGFKNQDTWVAFTNGDFFGDHTHQDVNAFQIHRGGDLAIDSGRYDDDWDVSRKPADVGRSQFFNYYQRTIAHNTMLVFDPSETFENGLLNDGGQLHHLWRGKHRNVPEDYAQGNFPSDDGKGTSDWTTNPGRWERGDIVAYQATGDFVFVRGDGTKAYSKNKVSAFVRELLFLQPRIVVVFDRVVATNAAFEKTWLLHSVNEPALGEGTFEIKEGEGRLFGVVVLPEKRRLGKVGGPEDAFRVGDVRFKAGPASVINPTKLHYGELPGGWRIEEKPAVPAGEDHFLNVMLVTDRASDEKPRVTAELAADEVRLTVRAGEVTAKARFAKGPRPSTHLTLTRAERVVFDGPLADRVVR